MKVLVVGGNFGEAPKPSSIVTKISNEFEEANVVNGGELVELPHEISSDLIIWMPNIINEVPKQYPKKSVGNVLIVSKVMREGYSGVDAVSRIFKMHGNAVIAIYKEEKFRFKLIDALGNTWYNSTDLVGLVNRIKDFYDFTRSSIRYRTSRVDGITNVNYNDNFNSFIGINRDLAEHIQTSCGERFFGNLSTRCMQLFPSKRSLMTEMFVSPRNSNKQHIEPKDMVFCKSIGDIIAYDGEKKPSVDAPVQLLIYNDCPQVNYMIHGHAFIKGAVETSEYFVCGDVREATEVIEIIGDNSYGAINLKNHGFLLYADTLANMEEVIDGLEFSYERKPL